MALIAARRYLGRWYTRRVRLLPDEKLLVSNDALEVSIEWLGTSQPGALSLTDKRLVFTPWAWPAPIREVRPEEIKTVEVAEPRGFGIGARYCVLRFDTSRGKLRFAFVGRLKTQRKRAHEWLEAIQQWMN